MEMSIEYFVYSNFNVLIYHKFLTAADRTLAVEARIFNNFYQGTFH